MYILDMTNAALWQAWAGARTSVSEQYNVVWWQAGWRALALQAS